MLKNKFIILLFLLIFIFTAFGLNYLIKKSNIDNNSTNLNIDMPVKKIDGPSF